MPKTPAKTPRYQGDAAETFAKIKPSDIGLQDSPAMKKSKSATVGKIAKKAPSPKPAPKDMGSLPKGNKAKRYTK